MKFYYFLIPIFLTLNFSLIDVAPKGLQVGDQMPYFSLINQKGESFDSQDHIGKQPMLIFFFKKGTEALCKNYNCAFRNSFDGFKDLDMQIAGVSADNVTTHYAYAKKMGISFPLLSDHKKRVHKLFGFSKSLLKRKNDKVCYISDKQGKIIYVINSHSELQKKISEIVASLKS